MNHWRIFPAAALLVVLAFSPLSCSDMIARYRLPPEAAGVDYFIIVDITGSMASEDALLRTRDELSAFLDAMALRNADARYAVAVFQGQHSAHELILDWTDDEEAAKSALALYLKYGPGAEDYSLEGIRIVLGRAVNNALYSVPAGGYAGLTVHPERRKKLLLFTDEDGDWAYYAENRFPGQTAPEPPVSFPTDPASGWVMEIEATAAALAGLSIDTYLFINHEDAPAIYQFGDPARQAQNADYSGFDPAATLQNLTANGLGGCLQARLLGAGLVSRALELYDLGEPGLLENVLVRSFDD